MKTEQICLFVVEDDDVDFLTVQRSLRKKRIANPVIRARDGVEALEMLAQEKVPKPFIILLDLQMPRMTGIEFLRQLRSNPAYNSFNNSVVFVLSTSNDEQDILNSYKEFVAGYFVKEETGDGFLQMADMLDGYWKIVHLPVKE